MEKLVTLVVSSQLMNELKNLDEDTTVIVKVRHGNNAELRMTVSNIESIPPSTSELEAWKVALHGSSPEGEEATITGIVERVVRYKVGEWALPPLGYGPMSVFRTLEDAQEFCRKDGSGRDSGYTRKIHRCNYRLSDEDNMWAPSRLTDSKIIRYALSLPQGTVLTSAVRLLEVASEDTWVTSDG